jgi:hypothetical protein
MKNEVALQGGAMAYIEDPDNNNNTITTRQEE